MKVFAKRFVWYKIDSVDVWLKSLLKLSAIKKIIIIQKVVYKLIVHECNIESNLCSKWMHVEVDLSQTYYP